MVLRHLDDGETLCLSWLGTSSVSSISKSVITMVQLQPLTCESPRVVHQIPFALKAFMFNKPLVTDVPVVYQNTFRVFHKDVASHQ